MHQYGGRRVKFWRLMFTLAMQRHLILGLMLLHLFLSIGDKFHLPTYHSLHPPRRLQVSPIHAPEVPESPVVPEAPAPPPKYDAFEPVPPYSADVVEPVPPPGGEAVEDAEPFGEGPVELSLLPLYPYHTTIHTWGREIALVGFILFNLRLLIYYKFRTLIFIFCRTMIR